MANYSVSPFWKNIDMDSICENWTVDAEGNERRMGNTAVAGTVLVGAVNHIVAYHPRIHFWKATPYEYVPSDADTIDPLYLWNIPDYDHDGYDYQIRVKGIQSANTASFDDYGYMYQYGNPSVNTPKTSLTSTLDVFGDSEEFIMYSERGNVSNAMREDGVSAKFGFKPLDIVVQDEYFPFGLDTTKQNAVDTSKPRTGQKVLADWVDSASTVYEEKRKNIKPVILCWAAQATNSGWSTPSVTNTEAIVIDSTVVGDDTFVNILDQAITSRTATTPGFTTHCNSMYWGNDATQYPVIGWNVLAKTTGTNVDIKLEASRDSALLNGTVTGTTQWIDGYGFNLDASISDTDTTTGRNKTDIFAKVTGGDLYIYGIMAWIATG